MKNIRCYKCNVILQNVNLDIAKKFRCGRCGEIIEYLDYEEVKYSKVKKVCRIKKGYIGRYKN